jgi:hypothetical protein
MIHPVKAPMEADGFRVVQTTRFRVHCMFGPDDTVGVGSLVFVHAPASCPNPSVGFVREIGKDGMGDLIVRIALLKADPLSWPTKEVWVCPDALTKPYISP